MAFAALCPAVTIECGHSGVEHGVEHAAERSAAGRNAPGGTSWPLSSTQSSSACLVCSLGSRSAFRSAELIRLADSGTGAVHRVLTRLADTGLLTVTRSGNQKHYQANQDCPVFAELHGLIVKTVGVVEPIRETLAPRAGEIRAAFVYGFVARGAERFRQRHRSPATRSDIRSCSKRWKRPKLRWRVRSTPM
jgi:hypothetical protein